MLGAAFSKKEDIRRKKKEKDRYTEKEEKKKRRKEGRPKMATMKKPHVGRPPKFTSAEEMQAKIDEYFAACKGHPMTDDEGKPVLDKFGRPIILDSHPPTITGLALALGFSGRQGLLTYQGKKAYCDTITRAKSKCEQYAEERLFDRDGSNGAKFSLQNNFSGWTAEKEKTETAEDKLGRLLDALTEQI